MEGECCEECRGCQESIYWTQFQCMRFCQILKDDFHSQLMIPEKFSDNVRGKLHETVTLKGPGGTSTWEIGLMRHGDLLFLKDGWEKFVNAFSLEENDILIFKYNGNSCFDVLIFDRRSLCEKESSYFITKCGHSKHNNRQHEKRCLKEIPEEVIQEDSPEDFDSTPSKKPKKDIEVSRLKAPCVDVDANKEKPKNREPSLIWEPVKLPPVAEKQRREKDPNRKNVKSRKRSMIDEQKEAALKMARKELTEDSFLVVMRPSHVQRKFYMTVPAQWIATHLDYRKQVVRLRIKEKTWTTRLIFSSEGRGWLCFGWKEFSLANCLKEFDVCVFKLASQKHEPVVLDVSIFRVVSEAVK